LTQTTVRSMWDSIPHMLLLLFLSVGLLYVCCENSLWELFFVAVAAYIAQSVIYSAYIIVITAFHIRGALWRFVCYVIILAATIAVVYFIFAKRLRGRNMAVVDNRILLLLGIVAGATDTLYKFYMIEHGLGEEAGGVFFAWKGFSMLTSILVLCVQFGILERNSIREEQRQLEELLYLREKQFKASRENMELINIKCHDLKHWFQKIQTLDGEDYRKEAAQMQDALAIYDSVFHTGNETLDTILTEKKLYCEYNRIRLTCMAEGESLDFLTTAEICSLFGNIIDNAIEAVMKIEDENSREISLSIRRRGMLLSIHEENYYAVEPVKHGDNFETSKEDQAHHGFGIRSIRMIVENHHGDMEITAKDGVFNLNILFT
ncbi:MAG: sensor histidine kinase, partial [Blautia sp.]|nr:sensor histidine kinase [Blautia sp.]